MSAAGEPWRPPVDFSHQALFYDKTDALVEDLCPFLTGGVAAGERVVAFAPPDRIEALQAALPPVRASLEVFPLTRDRPRPAQALSTYYRLLRDQAATGQPIRVVSEQPLEDLDEEQVTAWCRVDAAFDAICAFPRTRVVCAYDQNLLPGWVLHRVESSHQMIGSFGEWRPSPHYQPGVQLLAQELGRDALEPPTTATQMLPSPNSAREARDFIRAAARGYGLIGPDLEDFHLATAEAVANAFKYATIQWVRLWAADGQVVCEVRDNGPGLPDPLAGYRQPDPTSLHGRGLWMAHHLCDRTEVHSGSWGTIVRLYKTTRPAT